MASTIFAVGGPETRMPRVGTARFRSFEIVLAKAPKLRAKDRFVTHRYHDARILLQHQSNDGFGERRIVAFVGADRELRADRHMALRSAELLQVDPSDRDNASSVSTPR